MYGKTKRNVALKENRKYKYGDLAGGMKMKKHETAHR